MRPPLIAAAALALVVAALFGFGHALGAWDEPAVAERGVPAMPVTQPKSDAPKEKNRAPRDRRASKPASRPKPALPAPVVAQLDELCGDAHAEAQRFSAAPPESKQAMRRLLQRLARVSAGYNARALELLAPHADDPRTRRLAGLFEREERLFARLIAAVPGLDTSAGRIRFESRFAELRVVGFDEAAVLVGLGAGRCDVAPAL